LLELYTIVQAIVGIFGKGRRSKGTYGSDLSMPLKDKGAYRNYMKDYMKDYRAWEREILRRAKQQIAIPIRPRSKRR